MAVVGMRSAQGPAHEAVGYLSGNVLIFQGFHNPRVWQFDF